MADYNINAITRRVVFTGSAGLGPYAFTFEVLDENDVAVYFNTTLLTLTTDYTVTINANGTGSVTIVTGSSVPSTPTASDSIIIVGARDIERVTDFVTAGDLLASSLNEQLDALTIFDQQLAEENARTLRAPVYDPALVADGGTLDMTLPAKAARAGKYLQFNSTTGNPEAGPDSTDVTALADIATDIATLADIEDGTDATDAIQTVAGISANVTTVAGIASNVSTVAGIQADVTAVAGDATDIGTVATNIASVNTVAGNISEVVAVANDLNEAVSEVETVANDLNEAVSEIETVAASISNVDTVGTNIANVNTVAGIDSNVTTVAGISANVTTVAGISGNVTTVAGISGDVTTVAADGTDIGTVAGAISNVNTVAGISGNVTTVAGISGNVTTVANNDANVTTVATNIADVNNFADKYRISATAPTTSLDEGDLYFNTTDNQLYVYNGSAWQAASPDIVGDTTPQLGGDLDTNGNDINFGDNDKAVFGAGSDLQIYHDGANSYIDDAGAGVVALRGSTVQIGKYTGELMAQFVSDGAVQLRYDNSQKLTTTATGADITGTLTADDNIVLDGASSPAITITDTTNSATSVLKAGNVQGIVGTTSNHDFFVRSNDTNRIGVAAAGDVSLYADDGTTQGFYWDASTQRLGLGTTGPSAPINIEFNNSGNSSVTTATIGTSSIVLNDADTGGGYRNLGLVLKTGAGEGVFYGAHRTSSSNISAVIGTNDTERLRIDEDGNVGIGTSSPDTPLEVKHSSTADAIKISGNANGIAPYLSFENQESGTAYVRGRIRGASNGVDGGLIFETGSSGSMSEAMRIDSNGQLMINQTSSPVSGPYYLSVYSADSVNVALENSGTASHTQVRFINGNGIVGTIVTNASATSYNTSSDYRLKENVTADWDATTRLKQLNPVRFNFIADADTTVDGFLAHEVQSVVPEAITGTKDAVDADGNPVYQGIDQSKLVPLLVKTIQELEARIAALEAK